MNLKKAEAVLFLVVFSLLIVELVLRVQQTAGPLYDLALKDQGYEKISDTLNHVPAAEESFVLADKKIYGHEAGFRYTIKHDQNGIRINDSRPLFPPLSDPINVLVLGDSFVEGYGDSTTLLHFAWKKLQITDLKDEPINLLNAGHSSYSPAIFIPQAKQLIPKLKPDLVVIVIDETDLGDDFIRYRNLIVRDEQGRIVAVRPTPINVELTDGLLKVRRHKLYLVRFFHKIWHTRVHMPSFRKGYRSWYPDWILTMSKDRDPNAERKYHQQIGFFEQNLTELIETVAQLMGGKDHILFVYHPHLQHLKPDADGFVWNNFTADAVQRVTDREEVDFYNVTRDMRAVFGDRPESFYWKGEMHFNFGGFAIYGRLLADRLYPLLKEVIASRDR